MGTKPAGISNFTGQVGQAEVSDIKKAASPVKDADIPIIDENEPMNSGVEEDEMSIKEKDLPF